MFQPGDLVVYGSSGVCRVIQVGTLEGKSADPSREYYTLQPMFEAERIYTPVDSGVFMRPAMTKEQARDLIRQIPFIQEDLCTERNPTNLRIHYEASLQSHQCRTLVSLDQRHPSQVPGNGAEGPENGPSGSALPEKSRRAASRGVVHCPGDPPGPGGRVYSTEYAGRGGLKKGPPQGPAALRGGAFLPPGLFGLFGFLFDDPPFAVGGRRH